MSSHKNRQFALVCLFLFVGGALLRVRSGWLTLPRLTPSVAPGAGEVTAIPLPPGLGETVLNFYRWLDRGSYQNAYQISLVDKWQVRAPKIYVPAGLASEQEFTQAATEAWGVNGADLTINEMGLVSALRLDAEQRQPSEHPELYALAALAPYIQVEDVYEVGVRGSVIERCAPWEWSKHLLVAKLSSGDWKILLPGVPDPEISLLQAVFLDQDLFAGLQIQEK